MSEIKGPMDYIKSKPQVGEGAFKKSIKPKKKSGKKSETENS